MPAEDTAVEEKPTDQTAETAEAKTDAADAQAIKAVETKMKELGIPDSDATPAQDAPGETDKVERTDDKDQAGKADADAAGTAGDNKPKAEETGAEKPETLELTPSQRETGKHLGYSDEELDGATLEDAKALDRAGHRFRSRMAEIGDKIERRSRADSEAGGEGDNKGASDAKPSELEFTDADLDGDGDITGKLNRLAAQNKQLASELAEMKTDRQDEREVQIERNVDTFFEGLGKEFDQFGEGPLANMEEDSPECQARVKLMNKAAALRRGYAGVGQSMTLKQSLNEALAIVAHDQIRASERKKLAQQIEERSKQRIGQPGGKPKAKASETTDERAIRKVRELAASRGLSTKG